MDTFRKIWRAFWANLSNIALITGWLVSLGFFPALLSLTEGASPLDYGIAAVAGLILFLVGRWLWMGARLWRANARIRERLSSDSSPFDPMARIYEGKRLFLKDLAPAGRREVQEKKFVNCEIIGPGAVVLGLRSDDTHPWPDFRNNTFYDVDCIEMNPEVLSNTATYFPDCDFDGCRFYQMSLLFFARLNPSWHWITPDYSQPKLIEDQTNGK